MQRITEIPRLQPRRTDAHKGDCGRVLIVGGSAGMIGAPALAGLAALRSGAGLVKIATPYSIAQSVGILNPCGTTLPLPEDRQGRISTRAAPMLLEQLPLNDVIVVGPGINQGTEPRQLIQHLLRACDKPLILDADALNNIAALRPYLPTLRPDTVLTPHPGEFDRLWEAWSRDPQPDDRTEKAAALAEKVGCIVVLKGAGTVVTDTRRLYVNDTGNPGLATGGTGDVLTGGIAALAAQGLSLFDATVLGIWAHGRAADEVVKETGQPGLIASDLPLALAKILAQN